MWLFYVCLRYLFRGHNKLNNVPNNIPAYQKINVKN